MPPEYFVLLPVLFGWLLGLLGPPIVDRIRRSYKREEVKIALLTELYELRFTMAAFVFRVRQHLGTIDHDMLDWLLPLFEEYRGGEADPKALEQLRTAHQLPSSALQAGNINKSALGIGLSLKTYSLPLLQAQVSNLSILPPTFQQEILDLHSKVDLFNQQCSALITEHGRTFDSSLSPENHAIVRKNLANGYQDLGERARRLADLISKVLRGFRLSNRADG